jgi:hypothetical protein
MDAWEYTDIVTEQAKAGRLYHEFLRVPDLSARRGRPTPKRPIPRTSSTTSWRVVPTSLSGARPGQSSRGR